MPEFYAKNTGLYLDDKKIKLKGVNIFGFETEVYCLHGLWQVSLKSLLDFIQNNNFNAVRLPVSMELIFGLDTLKCKSINTSVNPELKDITAGKLLDLVIDECHKRNILVMPDIHRFTGDGTISELWYDDKNPESRMIDAWKIIVKRYINKPNVFAIDLKNEPHGRVTWGNTNPNTDWNKAAERIGNSILDINPKLLIFVEGVERFEDQGSWWGGTVAGAVKYPVKLKIPDKLVYSPHVYGPSVFNQTYFHDKDFPKNLQPIWDKDFGFLKKQKLGTLVLGEWGGRMTSENKDDVWQNTMGDYIKENDIDFFYWCLNPNSQDTAGLLEDDWKTPVTKKLQLLERVCPNPTKFSFVSQPTHQTPVVPQPIQSIPQSQETTKPQIAKNVTVNIIDVNQWNSSSANFYQQDVNITNTTTETLKDVDIQMSLMNGSLEQFWNCKCKIQSNGFSLSFPQWLIDNGGLKQGQSIKLGYVSKLVKPKFTNLTSK